MLEALNKTATKQKAVKVLESYHTYKRIAGSEFESKVTATYSFEPRSYTGAVSKPIETYVVRKVEAETMVRDIEHAINLIHGPELRQVLIMKYCRYYDKDIAIYVELGYSETEFYRLWEKAVLYFAECYRYGELLTFLGDF